MTYLNDGLNTIIESKITRYTRAGEFGKEIICPKCSGIVRVYNFGFKSLKCIHCGQFSDKENWGLPIRSHKYTEHIIETMNRSDGCLESIGRENMLGQVSVSDRREIISIVKKLHAMCGSFLKFANNEYKEDSTESTKGNLRGYSTLIDQVLDKERDIKTRAYKRELGERD
jgi:hypothetical protein